MFSLKKTPLVCGFLAVVLLATGCRSRTICGPTFANFGSHLREGNEVKLGLKNGEVCEAEIRLVRTEGLLLAGVGHVPYGAMASGRKVMHESGLALWHTEKTVGPVVAVAGVVAAGVLVMGPFFPLLLICQGGGKR